MRQDYTHIIILLDKSGSMGGLQKDVIGGINTLIADQRKLPGKATVTLAQFDDGPNCRVKRDGYVVNYSFQDINLVADLNERTYVPSGMTALRDSFAKLIDDEGAALAKLPENERPARVLFVIQTDGEENSSLKVSTEDLKTRVKTQSETYNWQFMFLGANIDAFAAARSYGIKDGDTIQFAHTSRGTSGSYKATSNLMSMKRSASVKYMSQAVYSDGDRALAADANSQNTPQVQL